MSKFLQPCKSAACKASLSFTISQSLLKLMSTAKTLSHWCHPTTSSSAVPFSSCIPSFPALGYFQWLALPIRWPNYWSFSFSISSSNEYPGLISFRIDWFDHLTVQRTLKSLLQHHSLKASLLRCSAFFMVQILHPYRTTRKTTALTTQTFVGKVMSLLFNTLSRFVIAFLPGGICFLISVSVHSDFGA